MTKILLIDDDPDICTVMSILLKKQGYAVATASKKEEALQKIDKEKPSLILLDVLLSGEDGRELCKQLKEAEATTHIPIIMFSAHPGAAVKFEQYGADDFIAKPFNVDELLIKLNQQVTHEK